MNTLLGLLVLGFALSIITHPLRDRLAAANDLRRYRKARDRASRASSNPQRAS